MINSIKGRVLALFRWVVHHHQPVTSISTVILALFTIVLAVIGFLALQDTRNTAERQLRAYVGAITQSRPIGPPGTERAVVSLYNSGTTPASKVIATGRLDIFPYPLPRDFVLPEFAAPSDNVNFTLNPGLEGRVQIQAPPARPFSDSDSAAARLGKEKRFYAWGTIRYRDAFGHNRWATYCVMYIATEAAQRWENCERHNDSN